MLYADCCDIVDDNIMCSISESNVETIPITDVAIVGEFTNEDGPFAEDHFIVFVSSDGRVIYTPLYDLPTDFLERLESLVRGHIQTRLNFQTTFRSRVLWPSESEGEELLSFTKQSLFTVTSELVDKFVNPKET